MLVCYDVFHACHGWQQNFCLKLWQDMCSRMTVVTTRTSSTTGDQLLKRWVKAQDKSKWMNISTTWKFNNLNMMVSKQNLLWKGTLFSGTYVKFRGCDIWFQKTDWYVLIMNTNITWERTYSSSTFSDTIDSLSSRTCFHESSRTCNTSVETEDCWVSFDLYRSEKREKFEFHEVWVINHWHTIDWM